MKLTFLGKAALTMDILTNKIFHNAEKHRLTRMRVRTNEREMKTHADFISKVRDSNRLQEHTHRIEHHGANFWKFYFPGEQPSAVLQDDPIGGHVYGTMAEQARLQDHMLVPDGEQAMDGVPPQLFREQTVSENRWLASMEIAETAIARAEYQQAEKSYAAALNETRRWTNADPRTVKTLRGLSRAVEAQGRPREATLLREMALKMDLRLAGTNRKQEGQLASTSIDAAIPAA